MSKCTDETCACLVEVCELRSQGTEVRARKGAWSGFHCFHISCCTEQGSQARFERVRVNLAGLPLYIIHVMNEIFDPNLASNRLRGRCTSTVCLRVA